MKITDDGVIEKQLRLRIYSEQDTYEIIAINLVCVSTVDQTVLVCEQELLNSPQKALWVGQRAVECVSQFVYFLWRELTEEIDFEI